MIFKYPETCRVSHAGVKLGSWLLALFIGLPCMDGSAAEQSVARPFLPQDAVRMRSLSYANRRPSLSRGGRYVAYVVSPPLVEGSCQACETANRSRGSEIWVSDTQFGSTVIVPGPASANVEPRWSPDGEELAFSSDRGGYSALWIWQRKSNTLRQVSTRQIAPTFESAFITWMPDGKSLVIPVVAPGPDAEHAPVVSRAPANVVIQRNRTAGAEPQPATREVDLVLVNTESARSKILAKSKSLYLTSYFVSPDHRYLAYLERLSTEAKHGWSVGTLKVVSIVDGAELIVVKNVVTRGAFQSHAMSWSPDSASLALTAQNVGDMAAAESNTDDCFVVDTRTGMVRNLTAGHSPLHARSIEGPAWSADGRTIYFVASGRGEEKHTSDNETLWMVSAQEGLVKAAARIADRDLMEIVRSPDGYDVGQMGANPGIVLETYDAKTSRSGYWRVGLDPGSPAKLWEEPVFLGGFEGEGSGRANVLSDDGSTFVFSTQSAQTPIDLWAAHPDFVKLTKVSELNSQLAKVSFGPAETFSFRVQGELRQAGLLLPPNYRPGTRLPVIVWPYSDRSQIEKLQHFGLERGDAGGAMLNAQVLATHGYAILVPETVIRFDTPASDIVESILPAIDRASQLGYIDPGRVGVLGHSEGAYMTLALLTGTNRFRAGVAMSGAYDLISTFGTLGAAFFNFGLGRISGSPWNNQKAYVDNSPIHHLDRLNTSLLLVHGAADGLPALEADKLFNDLQYLGRDVTYARYAGEGHVFQSPDNIIDNWNRILAFFDEEMAVKPAGQMPYRQ